MSNEVKALDVNVESPQCQFFVQRKKRLCRMTVKPGRRYCGEHEPQPAAETGKVDKRIPCPNDPKHTCYASKLLKHLAVCNARRTEQPAYIVENINAPEPEDSCPRRPLSAVPKDELMKLIDKVNHLYTKYLEDEISEEPEEAIHPAVAAEYAEPGRAESSLRHLRQASALLRLAEREGLVQDNTCYVELGAGKGQLSYYACHAWCGGARGGRVLAVDRAPLRHKRDNKLRSSPPQAGTPQPAAHEEIGGEAANRASDQLSHTSPASEEPISQVRADAPPVPAEANGSHDRSNDNDSKRKIPAADNDDVKLQHTTEDSKDCGVISRKRARTEVGSAVAARLRADLAHLALAAAPGVAPSAGVVGLAKHLCGVATDYALRCVAAPGMLGKTRGLVLATCCHHRCQRAPYVGRQHLQELGISAEEFDIMLGVVSWATCGDGRGRGARGERQPAPGPLTISERAAVGRRAKALLDLGRALWLRARGFRARLTRFVPAATSPENLCLVAAARPPATSTEGRHAHQQH